MPARVENFARVRFQGSLEAEHAEEKSRASRGGKTGQCGSLPPRFADPKYTVSLCSALGIWVPLLTISAMPASLYRYGPTPHRVERLAEGVQALARSSHRRWRPIGTNLEQGNHFPRLRLDGLSTTSAGPREPIPHHTTSGQVSTGMSYIA